MTINSSGHVSVPVGYIGNSLTDNFTLNGKTTPHYGLQLSGTGSKATADIQVMKWLIN